MAEKTVTTIEVGVTYAGSANPFKREYPIETPLSQVKADVLNAFELTETTDLAGNQTVYFLYRGGDRLSDLSQSVGAAADHHRHLQLRLVREVIAG